MQLPYSTVDVQSSQVSTMKSCHTQWKAVKNTKAIYGPFKRKYQGLQREGLHVNS